VSFNNRILLADTEREQDEAHASDRRHSVKMDNAFLTAEYHTRYAGWDSLQEVRSSFDI
jgi:hypothetical protein